MTPFILFLLGVAGYQVHKERHWAAACLFVWAAILAMIADSSY